MHILYDHIGEDYDATRKADPGISQRIYSLLNPTRTGSYLDLACGTGNYTIALHNLGVSICGVDQSELMLRQAKKKAPGIEWHFGSAEDLPFLPGSFQGVSCVLATHHFKNIRESFREVFRIINKGRFVIFTAYQEQMKGYWLNEYFPRPTARATKKMLSKAVLFESLKTTGFKHIREEIFEVAPDVEDLFLQSGKYRPEIYLLPQVRAGISTFANLALEEEVEEGCRRLEQDIHSGRIKEVTTDYANSAGDYVFVAAEKD